MLSLWRRLWARVKLIFNKCRVFLCGHGHSHGPGIRLDVMIGLPQPKNERPHMIEITLTNEQKVKVSLKPVTQSGKPATVDGAPQWEVVSGDSTVVPASDGLSADLLSSDTPGDTQFLIKADADLGSGVQEVSEIVTLHVQGANAANLGVVVGTPELK